MEISCVSKRQDERLKQIKGKSSFCTMNLWRKKSRKILKGGLI